MNWFSKDIASMEDLFIHTLNDIYYAENQIIEALPAMIDKAANARLKQILQLHLLESKQHMKCLDKVFQMVDVNVQSINCPAIDGIIEETNELAADIRNPAVLDAAMIASAQAIEHYKICRYGSLVSWAKMLGRPDCASLLQQTLIEEQAADAKLASIGDVRFNLRAA